MATAKTTYVSQYELDTSGAVAPAGKLDQLLRTLAKDAKTLERQLAAIRTAGGEAGAGLDEASDKVEKVSKRSRRAASGIDGLVDKLKDFRKSLGLVAVGAGFALITKAILDIGARFEQIGVQLRTVFGDEAEEVFERFRTFAATTPFTLDAITDSAIRLKAVGLEPTRELMTSIGDTSAAFGKDISQFSQAVIQATVGEMEMLKQFGIIARQQGDVVRFTFQGVTTEVARESGAIVEYLQNIGATQFAGAMEEQSRTLTGRLSTLKDAASELAAGIFDLGLGGAAGEAVTGLTTLLGKVNAFVGALRDEQEELERGRDLLVEYQESLRDSGKAQDDFTDALKRTAAQVAAQSRFQELKRDLDDLIAAQKEAEKAEKQRELAAARAAEGIGGPKSALREATTSAKDYEAAIEAAQDRLNNFVKDLQAAAREGATSEFLGLDKIPKEANAAGNALDDLTERKRALEERIKAATERLRDEQAALADERSEAKQAARDHEDLIDRQVELTDALQDRLDVQRELAEFRGETFGGEINPALRDILLPSQMYTPAEAPAAVVSELPSPEELEQLGEDMGSRFGSIAARVFGSEKLGQTFGEAASGLLLSVASQMIDKLAGSVSGGGTSQFGGERAGNLAGPLSQAGGQIGSLFGPVGEVYGKAFGLVLGSFFKTGADEALVALEQTNREIVAKVKFAEGGLGDAAQTIGDELTALVERYARLAGDLDVAAAGLSIKIRGDLITVNVRGLSAVFRDLDEAIAYAAGQVIHSQETAKQLGENFAGLSRALGLAGADLPGSFAELQEAFALAEKADALFLADGLYEIIRTREHEMDLMRRYGLVAADILALTDQRIEAEKRAVQEALAAAQGVNVATDLFENLQQDVEEFNAFIGEENVARRAELEAAKAERDELIRQQEALGGRTKENAEEWFRLKEAIDRANKEVQALEASFETMAEAISPQELQAALRSIRQNLQVDLLQSLANLADLAGKGTLAEELRARALALSTKMQLLSIRLTLQAARAAGILSDEQVRGFNEIIRAIRDGIIEAGGFGALGRQQGGGGGGGDRRPPPDVRTRADALEDFNRLMMETGDVLEGVTAEERRRLEVLERLDEDLAAGLLTADEYAAAILNLTMVQEQAAERLADEATAAWAELGQQLDETALDTRLRQFWERAQEAIDQGGVGIPEVVASQVEAWFRDGLEGADDPEEFEALRDSWTGFLATLPDDVRGALEASGIGQEIAAGIASAVRAEDVAAFLEAAQPGGLPGLLDDLGTTQQRFRGGGGGGAEGRTRTDDLARLREELEKILEASASSRLGPLKRELDGIFESFERVGAILRTLDAAAEEWNEAAREMAATLGRFYDEALAGARELLEDITAQRATPAQGFLTARERFETLTADLPSDLTLLDPDQITAIVAAGRDFREAGAGLFGEGFGAGVFDPQIAALMEELIAAAPEEQDLVLLALQHLQEQAALQLDATTSGLGGGGAIAVALDTSAETAGAASLAQLVEIARLTGVLSGTVKVLDELSPDQLDELQETVARLLSLESLSDAQRSELQALQTVLDNQDIIDLLSGTLDVADTLSADELKNVLALLGGTLDVADQLAPSQIVELRGIVSRLLALDTLSQAQRDSLAAAQASLAGIDTGTAAVVDAVDDGTAATEEAASATDHLADVVGGQQQELARLRNIVDRLGPGDVNASLEQVKSKLTNVVDRLGAGSPLASRLDLVASRISTGNASLASIDSSLRAIRQNMGLGGAG